MPVPCFRRLLCPDAPLVGFVLPPPACSEFDSLNTLGVAGVWDKAQARRVLPAEPLHASCRLDLLLRARMQLVECMEVSHRHLPSLRLHQPDECVHDRQRAAFPRLLGRLGRWRVQDLNTTGLVTRGIMPELIGGSWSRHSRPKHSLRER
eukprot:3151169-Rhodomonas_salina.1